jgi:hypothetical protein
MSTTKIDKVLLRLRGACEATMTPVGGDKQNDVITCSSSPDRSSDDHEDMGMIDVVDTATSTTGVGDNVSVLTGQQQV